MRMMILSGLCVTFSCSGVVSDYDGGATGGGNGGGSQAGGGAGGGNGLDGGAGGGTADGGSTSGGLDSGTGGGTADSGSVIDAGTADGGPGRITPDSGALDSGAGGPTVDGGLFDGGSGGGQLPCDIAASAGTPCVVAYSMVRQLLGAYRGNLFKLQRDSDNATQNIGVVNGRADVVAASSFCAATTCRITTVYDQTSYRLDAINSVRTDMPAENCSGLWVPRPPIYKTTQIGGKTVPFWGDGFLQAGSRANPSLSNGGMPVGSVPVTEYAIALQSAEGACCYDFGEAEATIANTDVGHMFALNLGGSFVGMDLENGGIYGGPPATMDPRTVLGKTDGVSLFTLKRADGLAGSLKPAVGTSPNCPGMLTFYNQQLSCFGYGPMSLEGGLTIGVGGDGSGCAPAAEGGAAGAFIEGVVIAGQTSDATDDGIQASINALFGP